MRIEQVGEFTVAFIDGIVVGSWDNSLDIVVVHPEHRRKGIATALYKKRTSKDTPCAVTPAGCHFLASLGLEYEDWALNTNDPNDERTLSILNEYKKQNNEAA